MLKIFGNQLTRGLHSDHSANDVNKKTFNLMKFKYFLLHLLVIILFSDNYFLRGVSGQQTIANNNFNTIYNNRSNAFSGGPISGHRLVLTLRDSPYHIFRDIYVDSKSELVIESGVTIHFNHSIGVTVEGTLIAKVCLKVLCQIVCCLSYTSDPHLMV